MAGQGQDPPRAGHRRERDAFAQTQILLLRPERRRQRSRPTQSTLRTGALQELISRILKIFLPGQVIYK